MRHLEIIAECPENGDAVTAITECQKVAKALSRNIELKVRGFAITIRPESHAQDLIQIFILHEKLSKIKPV